MTERKLVEKLFNNEKLKLLVDKFNQNIAFYKDSKKAYNEHSCRVEYIDPFLKLIGWDVANEKGAQPQYREVVAENYSTQSDRPDYTLTLRGVSKLFVEAKKPSVDISKNASPAIQSRKYGWNAKHAITILTNFEYLVIYDTTYFPQENDDSSVARYKMYHYTEYIEKFEEIYSLISREYIYSGDFDKNIASNMIKDSRQTQQVDRMFLSQINEWRIALSNELYSNSDKYKTLDVLNDVVQSFINKIVFLRICEDKNLPVYYKLDETISELSTLHKRLEELFRAADKKYNSGLFSGDNIIFDLNSSVIVEMIKGLYYPKSPFLFNIIEPNLLGKIYELFLTEQLVVNESNRVILATKKECVNRSVVTTPTEVVKYMVEKTLSCLCKDKTPSEIMDLKISDIACGSGVFLEETFDYLQAYCTNWYIDNDPEHLIEYSSGNYKLPLQDKKDILTKCIYGIDIDINAVEVAKFSLLVKLIEDESTPSVEGISPILPDLSNNIFYGNALISNKELSGYDVTDKDLIDIAPLDWEEVIDDSFDAILGNPPYVSTEGLHSLISDIEFKIYKKNFKSSHKQFDKYFIFLEHAISKVKESGYVCYIIPNKFFKIGAGEKLRELISKQKTLVSLDDFGDAQLFEDKTIYSSIVLMKNNPQVEFTYSHIDSAELLWSGENISSITMNNDVLNKAPWRLTADIDFLNMLKKLDLVSVPMSVHANIFNGIQTSAERPVPIYWFSMKEVVSETADHYEIEREGIKFKIEKSILRSYFKPTKKSEKGLNSYSILETDKKIIFPYEIDGKLINIEKMKLDYSGAYEYLEHYYDRLVPKCVSESGIRDVPNATPETWYQYGRTQALTAFINTPKLIVGILSRDAMYVFDNNDVLIASGGTAGYCAISKQDESPYQLEYLQAWLSNPITEKIISIVGSDFEGGFVSRGTFILPTLPFVELDFNDPKQKAIHDDVVELTREVYKTNDILSNNTAKRVEETMKRKKTQLIRAIESKIFDVYNLNF